MASSPHQDTGPRHNDAVQERDSRAEKTLRSWQPGVPFVKNRIPKPEGDMYEKLLAPLLEKDKMQCDAWKDEVQNLLIFAGLFSAVVTAFIVESYKGLQPDPNDIVSNLLLRIADRLDPPLNASTLTSSPAVLMTSFKPTPSAIRVNILWFISLILSLTTVLVGIISLQWLREHQKYDSFHGSELKFAIFNLRAESLARWYVPQVFAAMPLALQAALVLFFVGTIDFLLALHRQVAVPVIAVTGLPFFFLLGTTFLPAFQAFTLKFPFLLQINDEVPVPIPFKSPQSNIIRRLSTLSRHLFLFLAYAFLPFYLILVVFPSHGYKAVKQVIVLGRADIRNSAPFLKHMRYTWSKRLDLAPFYKYWTDSGSWTSSDAEWPLMRTQYASILHECSESEMYWSSIDRTIHGTGMWDFSQWIPNAYDCTRGFRAILKQTRDYDQVCRVGHCGQDFSIRYIQSLWNYKNKFAVPLRPSIIRSKGRALEDLLGLKDSLCKRDESIFVWPQFGDGEDPINLDIMHTLHIRAVLSSLLQYYHTEERVQNIRSAWTECQLDLIKPLLVHNPNLVLFGNLDRHPLFLELFFRHQVIFIPDLSRQWTSLLQQFFIKSATTDGLLEYTKTVDGVDTVRLDALDIVIWEIVGLQLPEDALFTMEFLAQILSAAIEAGRTEVVSRRPDFLAFTSSGYLLAWLNNGRDLPRNDSPVQAVELLDTLKAYNNSLCEKLTGSSRESRDERIRQCLEYNFNIAAKRFGEKYPAYVVQSHHNLTPAAVERSQPDTLMSERHDHCRSPSVVSFPDDGTREHDEGNNIA